MERQQRFLLFTFFLFFFSANQAQSPGLPPVSTYKLFQNETEWGSSARFINDLLLDSEGLLWIATNAGLIRWDGQRETFYYDRISEKGSRMGKGVHRVLETERGDILLLEQEGFSQIDVLMKKNGLRQPVKFPDMTFTENDFIADIIQTGDRDIYVAVNQEFSISIFKYAAPDQMRLVQKIKFPVSLREQTVRLAVFNEAFWLAVDDMGVLKYSKGEVFNIANFTSLGPTKTHFFHTDKMGRFWLGINSGDNLYQYIDAAHQFLPFKKPEGITFQQLKEDIRGNLIFARDHYPNPLGPMFILRDTQWMNVSHLLDTTARDFFPSHNLLQYVFQPTNNNVLTYAFDNPRVRALLQDEPTGEWGSIIKGIASDTKGNLYFLEEIDGFYKLDKAADTIQKIPIIDESGKYFYFRCGGSLHRGNQGNLWFKVCDGASNGFLACYNPSTNQFNFYPMKEMPRGIVIDEDYKIWVTHHSVKDRHGGVSYFDTKIKRFTSLHLSDDNEQDYFAEPRFIHLAQDSLLWVGTLEGLVRINKFNGKQRIYNTGNSQLKNDYIILIQTMDENNLLLGTNGGGMQIFDIQSGEVKSYPDVGTKNSFVCGALAADSMHWWLSTFHGLVYWDMQEGVFTKFGRNTQGIANQDFNRYAYFKARDGTFYFGNVNGVSAFRTEDMIGKGPEPAVGLNSIVQFFFDEREAVISSVELNKEKRLVIPLGVSSVQFNFYLGDYLSRNDGMVRVKIKGYDEDWQITDDQNKMVYRYLPPGEYELIAQGFSGRGVPSENSYRLPIVVQKPLYMRLWFLALIIILLGGLVWLVSNFRIRRLRKKEDENRKVNRKLAELELQALRAQLNPHFVSNALGAVQHTIREQNVEKAEDVLTKFAHLMRLFLESSKKKYITLAEELELIRLYVEIEQLRFRGRFDFSLSLSQDLDVHTTEVPSMLFQPFLENAINHGLFHKKGKGQLCVCFSVDEEERNLICTITDNGVGRKKAAEIKMKSIRNYRSRATQIVNERLDILKSVEGLDLEIDIVDLREGEQAVGTQVNIRIPLDSD